MSKYRGMCVSLYTAGVRVIMKVIDDKKLSFYSSVINNLLGSREHWGRSNLLSVILNSQLMGDFFDLIQFKLINSVNYSV